MNSGVSYSDDVVVMRVAFNNSYLIQLMVCLSEILLCYRTRSLIFSRTHCFTQAHFGFQIPIKKQVKLDLHCIYTDNCNGYGNSFV